MIRYRLRERIADLEFETGRTITFTEIAENTGLNRTTLSKLATQRGYTTSTEVLDRLCRYLGCQVGELAEYIPDEQVNQQKQTERADSQ